jgi:ABC-2 type transport system permease protein
MSHFFRLVHNENLKIYKRFSTWIMVGILILVVGLVGIFTRFILDDQHGADWKTQLQAENAQMAKGLEAVPLLEPQKKYYQQQMALNEYRIKNEIPPVERKSLWGYMTDATNFTGIAALFTIVIAAGIVAGEFSWGTIKLLLIRPVSRSKILLSKYVATLLFALLMLALLFSTSFLFGVLLYGMGGTEIPFLAYSQGKVFEQNMVTHIISLFGFRSIDLVMMVTLAFMISTVFRSSSLAIGISLFLMFTGPQFVSLLSRYEWVKYILFANTDLLQYINGIPMVEGMTMSFSIMMLILYLTLFILLSWIIFNKRDVAA